MGGISENAPGVKIAALTKKPPVQVIFPRAQLRGRIPRIQIAIDTDENGNSKGNAFGYVGTRVSVAARSRRMGLVAMTDKVPADGLTQFGLAITIGQRRAAINNASKSQSPERFAR